MLQAYSVCKSQTCCVQQWCVNWRTRLLQVYQLLGCSSVKKLAQKLHACFWCQISPHVLYAPRVKFHDTNLQPTDQSSRFGHLRASLFVLAYSVLKTCTKTTSNVGGFSFSRVVLTKAQVADTKIKSKRFCLILLLAYCCSITDGC